VGKKTPKEEMNATRYVERKRVIAGETSQRMYGQVTNGKLEGKITTGKILAET